MSPAPNRYHQEISGNIEFILRTYLESHPIGKIYHAPFDVYLTEHDVFQPDIVFIRHTRNAILAPEGVVGAPELVIEILSADTAALDKAAKKKTYGLAGVEELWLVDPEQKTVTIFRLQESPDHPAAVIEQTGHFRSRYFPGLVGEACGVFKS